MTGFKFQRPPLKIIWDPADGEHKISCLSDLINFNAAHNPHKLFCRQALSQPQNTDLSVSFLEFALAVKNCCDWLRLKFPWLKSTAENGDGILEKTPPVALLLESDVGLFIYLAALLALDVPCLLLSIRLSSPSIVHLLRETSAGVLLVSPKMQEVMGGQLETNLEENELDTNIFGTISFLEFLPSSSFKVETKAHPVVPRPVIREDNANAFILHSSGTTGLPKPIFLAQRYVLGYATCHTFADDDVLDGLNVSILPLYHGFGLLAPSLALSIGMPVCFPSSAAPPTASSTVAFISRLKASSLMTVPSMLEDIFRTMDSVELAVLMKLDFVAVGGGPMKPAVAKKMSASGIRLLNHYGATEIGPLAPITFPNETHDWRYLRLRDDLGLQLVPVESDSGLKRFKLIAHPFGWNSTFEIQDQLEVRPERPNSDVRILGRNDDLIVLSSGEKIIPTQLEQCLSNIPSIRAAVMFGDGQFELGILIEPTTDITAGNENSFVSSVWPSIQTAMETVDGHAKVDRREMILVTTAPKGIPRSDKGSPMRKETYELYKDEIEAVYRDINGGSSTELAPIFDCVDVGGSLREIVRNCFGTWLENRNWSDDDDFFEMGADSLQASRLRRILTASLRKVDRGAEIADHLPRDFIYMFPTLTTMAQALRSLPTEWSIPANNRDDRLQRMKNEFVVEPPMFSPPTNGASKKVVLLTGSTGNMGTFLLEALAVDSSVHKIVCLIRFSRSSGSPEKSEPSAISRDLREKQERSNLARGVNLSSEGWEKVTFLTWSPGALRLGINDEDYASLTREITNIYHGAWPMDFERHVASFTPHIQATRSLIQLAVDSHHTRLGSRIRFAFASSIAAVGRYPSLCQEKRIPEKGLQDPRVALPMGYSEAKWICERMVEEAALLHQQAVEAIVVRIGQIAGSTVTGYWTHEEHFPALVKLSKKAECFPRLDGSLSWLPVDRAAQVIREVLVDEGHRQVFYHVENPIRQPWKDMCIILSQKLNAKPLPLVSFQEWLSRVVSLHQDGDWALEKFFTQDFQDMATGRVQLDTRSTQVIAPSLSYGSVSVRTAENFVEAWRDAGVLS